MENEKINILDDDDDSLGYSAVARLIEFGHQKTYVTIDDILHFFPDAEQDVSQLEEAFAALMGAGIPYVEDDDQLHEPTEEELVKDQQKEPIEEVKEGTIDDLKHIDTDDTIGLYLKEVSRVPLLTADQEVELAQRIERGRMAREELASWRSCQNPSHGFTCIDRGWLVCA